MTLQVIGAGFGRTGTLSLKAALTTLGIAPCHHMVEVASRPEQAPRWAAAAHTGAAEWGALLQGFRAAVDWPSAAFWLELSVAFPDARVILTVRDAATWYASFRDTILEHTAALAPPSGFALRAVYDLTHELVLDRVLAGRASDASYAMDLNTRAGFLREYFGRRGRDAARRTARQ